MEDTREQPGRKLKFENVVELKQKIDAYFADCDPHMVEATEWVEARTKDGKLKKDKNGLNYLVEITHKVLTPQKHYTVTGLATFLGTTRETLLDYGSGKYDNEDTEDDKGQQFSDTIKDAKSKIEAYAENFLFSPSPTGTIFNLKNNFGWKDKTETDLTSGGDKINPFASLSEAELRKIASE